MAESAGHANGNGNGIGSGKVRVVYTNTVSLGNLLSIAAMLVAVVLAFSDVKGDMRVLKEVIDNNKLRLTKVENRVGLGDHPGSSSPGRP